GTRQAISERSSCPRVASRQLAQERYALAVIRNGIARPNHSLVFAKYLAKDASLNIRRPSRANARSEVVLIRVVRLRGRSKLSEGRGRNRHQWRPRSEELARSASS